MVQNADITCPECNTPHLSDDPFCENCGYRIGRTETAFEGYQAIPKEAARRAKERGGWAPNEAKTQGEDGLGATQIEIQPLRAGGETYPEGVRAVGKMKGAMTIREHAPLSEGTFVEGLAPVTSTGRTSGRPPGRTSASLEPETERHAPYQPASISDDASQPTSDQATKPTAKPVTSPTAKPAASAGSQPATGPATMRGAKPVTRPDEEPVTTSKPAAKPADGSADVVVSPSQANSRVEPAGLSTGVLALLWIVSVAGAIAATWFLTTHDSASDGAAVEADQPLPVAPAKVAIKGGTFERGLDEKVRSLILLSCQKMSSSPEDECDQDELIGGEFPVAEATVKGFEVDNAEVRLTDYLDCVTNGTCAAPAWDECKVYTHQGYQFALRVPKAMRGGDVPMTCVTRTEAATFCKEAGGRLPTNVEWEFAARGDDGRLFPWGNNWSSDLANWAEADIYRTPVVGELDGWASVAPPGQFPKGRSPHGVFDMAGNVAEWVAPEGDDKDGIARGGAWTSQPFDLRVTGRFELTPDTRRTDVGFRCVYPK